MSQTYGMKGSYSGGSSGILYTDRRDFYLNPSVFKELYPDITPFITFMAGLRTVRTQDPDFTLFEHRGKWLNMNGFARTAVNWDSSGSWNSVVASVTLATASGGSTMIPYLTTGDIIEIRAGSGGTRDKGDGTSGVVVADEVVARARVTVTGSTAVTSLTALDVDADGSNTYNVAQNDPFVIITRADEEGDTSPEAWADDLEKVYNSCQIIKTPVKITGTLLNMTRLRGASNELARLRSDKMKEHKMRENRAALLGIRIGGNASAPTGHITGAGGEPVRTSMGAIPLLEKYGTADEQVFSRAWASYSADSFIEDMEAASQYDNAKMEKFAFAGSHVLAELAKTGESSFFTRSGGSISLSDWKSTSFGFDIRTLTHPFGQIHITWDPSMRYGNYKNIMAIFDPENIERVVFRNDQYQTAIQENDADYIKDQYFSDAGIGLTLVEKHSLWKFS